MKIIKTHAATTGAGSGYGFGARAIWAVKGRADIRVWRDSGFWIAFADGRKLVATSRKELESMLVARRVIEAVV